MTFPPLIILAKALVLYEQLFPVVAKTWLGSKSDRLFLGYDQLLLVISFVGW